MFTIRQKIVNELKSEINWRIFEVGVFSRGVPTNQVLFTSCIDICLSCLQVGTRCHLFTSWYTFFAWSFVYKYTLSFVYKYTLSFVYKLLQCPSSSCINTFGNDVVRHNATTKRGSKVVLHTTQVNKASKILQSYGVSLHTMETEIQATEKFLQNYRTTGYDSAATSAVEIAQELDIDPSFPPSRSGKKRRLFDYQGEEEQRATPELKFKSNFFYPLVDQAIMSIKERFNLLREVSSAFSFLYTRDKLLLVQQENALLTCCKEFQKKFGDIDFDEMSAELQRFVLILQKNAISIRLKTF